MFYHLQNMVHIHFAKAIGLVHKSAFHKSQGSGDFWALTEVPATNTSDNPKIVVKHPTDPTKSREMYRPDWGNIEAPKQVFVSVRNYYAYLCVSFIQS